MKKPLPPPLYPKGPYQQVYDAEIRELLFLLKIGICFLSGFVGMTLAVMFL